MLVRIVLLGLFVSGIVSIGGSFSCSLSSSGFNVDVDWDLNDDVFCFTASTKFSDDCWLAIGFNIANTTTNKMRGGDIYLATFQSGHPSSLLTLDDRYQPLTGGYNPLPDTTFDGCSDNAIVPPRTASQIDGTTMFSFCRKRNTADSCDIVLDEYLPTYFLCAHGTSNNFGYHTADYRSSLLVTFSSLEDSDSDGFPSDQKPLTNYVPWHGSLMFLAFGILMPFGTFVARYLKSFWWWFPLHIVIQFLAFLLSITAFVLIVMQSSKVGDSFTFAHSYVGIVALGLAWVSPLLGLLSHLLWNPNREHIPIFPDKVHWFVARAAILTGFASIYMGIYRLENTYDTGSLILAYAFTILVVFYFASFIAIDFAQNLKISESGYDVIQ